MSRPQGLTCIKPRHNLIGRLALSRHEDRSTLDFP